MCFELAERRVVFSTVSAAVVLTAAGGSGGICVWPCSLQGIQITGVYVVPLTTPSSIGDSDRDQPIEAAVLCLGVQLNSAM